MTTAPVLWSVNSMYVACPACKTVYPVTAAQLRMAGGQVRCGNCDTVFEATSALFDEPQQALAFAEQQLHAVSQEIDDLVGRALDEVPATGVEEPVEALPVESDAGEQDSGMPVVDHEHDEFVEPSAEQDQTDQPVSPPQEQVTDLVDIAIETMGAGTGVDLDTYAAPAAGEFVPVTSPPEHPDEAHAAALLFDTGTSATRTSWGAIAAALLLTVLLLGQYVWLERYRLSAVPALRPYLDTACAVLGCDLPLRHETAKLEIVEREIRNHPNVNDALLVNATFINRADFVQRYPVFEVAFSDVSGTPVAVRRFLPDEYLKDIDPAQGMAPGQQTRVMLEIVDPGKRAVSFQFDFL